MEATHLFLYIYYIVNENCFFLLFVSTGTANNAGAILVIGRGFEVVPKLIHPLPPPLQSPESSPERVTEGTWMQVCHLPFSRGTNSGPT